MTSQNLQRAAAWLGSQPPTQNKLREARRGFQLREPDAAIAVIMSRTIRQQKQQETAGKAGAK